MFLNSSTLIPISLIITRNKPFGTSPTWRGRGANPCSYWNKHRVCLFAPTRNQHRVIFSPVCDNWLLAIYSCSQLQTINILTFVGVFADRQTFFFSHLDTALDRRFDIHKSLGKRLTADCATRQSGNYCDKNSIFILKVINREIVVSIEHLTLV